uniref:Uncharacterized protein n=1 Tax=Aegilops tauschii subsp. strangulata TaxID=200361 RepID=A0A452XFU9_AEGTS
MLGRGFIQIYKTVPVISQRHPHSKMKKAISPHPVACLLVCPPRRWQRARGQRRRSALLGQRRRGAGELLAAGTGRYGELLVSRRRPLLLLGRCRDDTVELLVGRRRPLLLLGRCRDDTVELLVGRRTELLLLGRRREMPLLGRRMRRRCGAAARGSAASARMPVRSSSTGSDVSQR